MITLSVRNITRLYRSATVEQLDYGTRWYRERRDECWELDPEYPRRAAAVLSVLSAQTDWPRNQWLAREAYRQCASGALTINLPTLGLANRKVQALLDADPDDEAERLRIVQGVTGSPKHTRFYLAIAEPDSCRSVTIDRHAFDVAAGRVTDNATRGAFLGRKGNYEQVQAMYQRAASILTRTEGREISPTEVQAVTWIVWRDAKPNTREISLAERAA